MSLHDTYEFFGILGAVATWIAAIYAWRAFNETRPTQKRQLRAWEDWLTYASKRPGRADLVDRSTPLSNLLDPQLASLLRDVEIFNRESFEADTRGISAALGDAFAEEREKILERHHDARAAAKRGGAHDFRLLDEDHRNELADFDLQIERQRPAFDREARTHLRDRAQAYADETLKVVKDALREKSRITKSVEAARMMLQERDIARDAQMVGNIAQRRKPSERA